MHIVKKQTEKKHIDRYKNTNLLKENANSFFEKKQIIGQFSDQLIKLTKLIYWNHLQF